MSDKLKELVAKMNAFADQFTSEVTKCAVRWCADELEQALAAGVERHEREQLKWKPYKPDADYDAPQPSAIGVAEEAVYSQPYDPSGNNQDRVIVGWRPSAGVERQHDGPCYEQGVLEGFEYAAKLTDRFEIAGLDLSPLAEEIRKLKCHFFSQGNSTSALANPERGSEK